MLRAIGQLDITIGLSYVMLLGVVGGLMVIESVRAIMRARQGKPVELRRPGSHTWIHGLPFKLRFKRSRIYVSAIPVLAIGFIIGFVGAVMGIGGGFLLVPMLIYVLRVPTATVIGTSMVLTLVTMASATVHACGDQPSGRCGAGADPHGRRRHRRAIRRAGRTADQRRAAAAPARPAGAGGRNPVRARSHAAAGDLCSRCGRWRAADAPAASRCSCSPPPSAITGAAPPAAAERLVTSLSEHRVMVTSSFNGSEVVLFGGIERDTGALPLRGNYDIAVTVIGPRQNIVTFRKERVLGIWVNYESRVFENAPSYLAVLTNRPLEAIASAETLRRLQLGLDNFALPQRVGAAAADDVPGETFRKALLQLKDEHGLYRQEAERRDLPHAGLVPGLDPAAGRGADRHLRDRREAVRRRHDDRAHTLGARDLQGRLRAVRHLERADPRRCSTASPPP